MSRINSRINRIGFRWVLLFSIVTMVFESGQAVTSLSALVSDQAAKKLAEQQRLEEALNVYVGMTEGEPNQVEIHSNIGVILSLLKKDEEALRSFQHALKLALDAVAKGTMNELTAANLFSIYFNLGVFYGLQKNIPEALKYYQAALDINPTSIETKTNIELLLQSQQNQNGQGGSSEKNSDQKSDQNKDSKQEKNQDQNQNQKSDQNKDEKQDEKQDKSPEKEKQGNEPKNYEKPQQANKRPFKGDQLQEEDVKKILGELRNQEQRIRANFDKKERKESGNEKDW